MQLLNENWDLSFFISKFTFLQDKQQMGKV